MPQRTVCIVLYPGCQSLDVTGPYEVFSGANAYLAARGKPPAYQLIAAGWRRRLIRSESGLRFQADIDLSRLSEPLDTFIVPGGMTLNLAEEQPGLVAAIRRHSDQSRRVVSVCTGAFLLAAAGLLDGRRVTTHWVCSAELARRYPQLKVDPEPIFIRDSNVYTSAGVTAGIDLALALVEEDLGRDVALTIARWLVLFLRRPANQRQFSAQLQGQLAERDALREVQSYVADHLHENLGVERLAELAAMSPRNFARCFKTETGQTPARYVSQLRLEAARRLLEEGNRPIEAIALECGFGTHETLRRIFLRELKTVPREYRNRFQGGAIRGEVSVPTQRRIH